MAKIIFIPDWLDELIQESGVTYEKFASDVNSVIVSRTDVINYYIAQTNFFKFLTGLKNPHSEYYSMYSGMFCHPIPDMAELTLELNKFASDDVKIETLVSTAQKAEDITLSYVGDVSNNFIVVIGRHNTNGGVEKNCEILPIIWSLLQISHNGLRVQNGTVDKSSVFRENPVLTQLYVESLCC